MIKNDFYNGNPQIKKSGVKQNFTEWEVQEYIKCRDDIVHFAKTYVKIITLDYGLQLFEPYEYQNRMLEAFEDHRFTINLLPRQTGKTTVVAAYLLHYALFTPEKAIGILANKEATSREILDRIKRMLENLPFFLQAGVKEYNKKNVIFGNDSQLLAFATGSDAVRGRSFNLIYLDEFAFVEHADDFYTSTYPVISSGKETKVIITSTPLGMNLFYKLWTDAKNGRNLYHPIEVMWNEHPDRDEAWREETIKNIGLKKYKQEYACKFIGSTDTLIDGDKLTSLVWDEPIDVDDVSTVYKYPEEGRTYVCTVDVSEGVGLDSSVINVTDITKMPYEQVYVWRSNTTTAMILPELVNRIATLYNEAYVLIETNSIGAQTATMLHYEYEYDNILTSRVANSDNVMSFSGGGVDFGLRMTKKSKAVGCSNIKALIENDVYKIADFNTIEEFQTFSRKGTSYEAEEGKHDDIVMTLVAFGWLSTQDYFIELTENDAKQLVLERKRKSIEEDLIPAGFYNDPLEGIEVELEHQDRQYDNGYTEAQYDPTLQ